MDLPYAGKDSGISLFVASMQVGQMTIATAGRTLDHCCAECDFLERAAEWWPEMDLAGVDNKPVSIKHPRRGMVQGDVMREDLFPAESFDQIVSLSAIEHIGLGHYGDPKDPDGDTKAVANCIRWLKPGGWLYLDVPYDPTGYRVQTTECRVYDDAALKARLLPDPAWVGYAGSDASGVLVPKPSVKHRRFWYVAMMWQKPHLPG